MHLAAVSTRISDSALPTRINHPEELSSAFHLADAWALVYSQSARDYGSLLAFNVSPERLGGSQAAGCGRGSRTRCQAIR